MTSDRAGRWWADFDIAWRMVGIAVALDNIGRSLGRPVLYGSDPNAS